MSATLSKVLLIAGALLLTVLLFFAPKTVPAPQEAAASPAARNISTAASLEVYLRTAEKNLAPEMLGKVEKLNEAGTYDSLVEMWTRMRRPDLASYYSEKKAIAVNTVKDWNDAGNRYYYSTQFVADKTEVPLLFDGAIRCFQKVLEKEPGNTDAKIMIASSYVDGSSDPMKGIGLLREVEKTDSNNVKLQLTFAFFSVKSGQLDKAITRFKKVLQLDPAFTEAYLHLADAYEQLGDKKATIEMLEKYASVTTDITARLEVEKYIKQLKETK